MNISRQQYMNILGRYVGPQRVRVLTLAALLLATTGLQLLQPQIVRYFIDTALQGGAVRVLLLTAGLFIGVALLGQVMSVGATYVGEWVGWSATNALRADLAEHCLNLDMSFHNEHTPGELIERIDGDVNTLSNFFSRFVVLVLGSMLLLLGVLVLLFREDWRVGATLTAFTVIVMVVLRKLRDVAVPHMAAEREANAVLYGFLEERLAGMADLRASGAGGYVMRRYHHHMRNLFLKGRTAEMMSTVVWVATTGMFVVGYAIAFGLGILLYRSGTMTIGTVYLIWDYTNQLRRPIEEISNQLQDLQKATASIGRVLQLYETQGNLTDGLGAPLPAGPPSVEFRNVSFGYNQEELVLHDVSFHLAPGEVLGLLGRTGSGKSTIARLLFRLYDPADGQVMLGGVDVRQARLEDLHGSVGMVTQQVQLFQGTVRDNLTLYNPHIPDEQIALVLDDVGLGRWLRSLPEGLDTQLSSGGSGLSAGDGQLLAFARVFLRNPGVVALDEASSRLDPATERLIEHAVDKLLDDRTGIIIAHRLATVERADYVLVLQDGKVLEHGRREVLAADASSRYSQLLRTGLREVLA